MAPQVWKVLRDNKGDSVMLIVAPAAIEKEAAIKNQPPPGWAAFTDAPSCAPDGTLAPG